MVGKGESQKDYFFYQNRFFLNLLPFLLRVPHSSIVSRKQAQEIYDITFQFFIQLVNFTS